LTVGGGGRGAVAVGAIHAVSGPEEVGKHLRFELRRSEIARGFSLFENLHERLAALGLGGREIDRLQAARQPQGGRDQSDPKLHDLRVTALISEAGTWIAAVGHTSGRPGNR